MTSKSYLAKDDLEFLVLGLQACAATPRCLMCASIGLFQVTYCSGALGSWVWGHLCLLLCLTKMLLWQVVRGEASALEMKMGSTRQFLTLSGSPPFWRGRPVCGMSPGTWCMPHYP